MSVGSTESTVECYREQAALLRQRAATTTEIDIRRLFVGLAEKWESLAKFREAYDRE